MDQVAHFTSASALYTAIRARTAGSARPKYASTSSRSRVGSDEDTLRVMAGAREALQGLGAVLVARRFPDPA